MNKQTRAISNDLGTFAEDASTLLAATADVPGDRVAEARKRLTAALEHAKATDQLVRENPYQTLAIALGVGAMIGYMVAHRRSRNGDRERSGTGPE